MKSLIIKLSVFYWLVFYSYHVSAWPTVEILALFNEKAVLLINGTQHLLRVGDASPEGVKLVFADPKSAKVEWTGVQRSLRLSRKISDSYVGQNPIRRQVMIQSNMNGQYLTPGSIDGNEVSFLVDTGANVVAINANAAARLGIDYLAEGTETVVTTAGGLIKGYKIMLGSVDVGNITVNNVLAVVIEGAYPSHVLLGMTFLKHVELREAKGVMTLEGLL